MHFCIFHTIWCMIIHHLGGNRMATAKRLSVKTPLIEQSGQAEPVRNKLRRGSSAMFRKTLNGNPVIGRPAIELIRDGYLASMLKSVSSFFNVSDARIQNIARVSATTASRLEQKNAKIDAAATEHNRQFGMSDDASRRCRKLKRPALRRPFLSPSDLAKVSTSRPPGLPS